jgi:hypothetical protein
MKVDKKIFMEMTLRWYGSKFDTVTLKQIRQIPGVKGVITTLYDTTPGEVWSRERIRALKDEVAAAGLHIAGIESVNVHDAIKTGAPERDQYIANYIETLENLGQEDIHLVCYNFMPVFDWTRTELAREREDGSTVLAYTRWGTKWSGAVEGLKHILRNEWDNNGLNIIDNVLTAYVNPADGMFGITTTCDSMMAFMPIGVLEAYENDAYMLTMMKEACYHNLYALANSIAMNGVGPDTTIKAVTPSLIQTVNTAKLVTYALSVVFGALWFVGKKKFVKTEEYKNYKAFKASLKK